MKKITMKGLCDFMTAAASRQRTVIRQFKYPSDDDAFAKIIYYREARDVITAYHRSGHIKPWLTLQAVNFANLAASSSGRTKTRLEHNARAIQSYANHFGTRKFDVLDDVAFKFTHEDIVINVVPDLHVIEKNQEKIIKLEFGVNEPDTKAIKIMSQIMFEAANNGGLELKSSGVLYLDVERGIEHRGARLKAVMRKNIEAACLNISSIWNGI